MILMKLIVDENNIDVKFIVLNQTLNKPCLSSSEMNVILAQVYIYVSFMRYVKSNSPERCISF